MFLYLELQKSTQFPALSCSISSKVIKFAKINYLHNTEFCVCDLCKTNLRSCIRKYLH